LEAEGTLEANSSENQGVPTGDRRMWLGLVLSRADVCKYGNMGREGHATAQVVTGWLPTAAARVQSQFRSRGIYGEQSGTGAGFLQVLQFPLEILIPTVPHSLSSEAGTLSQMVAGIPNRLSLTPPKEIKN
jgi:hypothetical protein